MTLFDGQNQQRFGGYLRDFLVEVAIMFTGLVSDPVEKGLCLRRRLGRHTVGFVGPVVIAFLQMVGFSAVMLVGLCLSAVGWADDGFYRQAELGWPWLLKFLWVWYVPLCFAHAVGIMIRHARRNPAQPLRNHHIPGGYIGSTWMTFLVPTQWGHKSQYSREEIAKRILEPLLVYLVGWAISALGGPIGFSWYLTIAAIALFVRNHLIFYRQQEFGRSIADRDLFSSLVLGEMVFANETTVTTGHGPAGAHGRARLMPDQPRRNAGGLDAIRSRIDPRFLDWLGPIPPQAAPPPVPPETETEPQDPPPELLRLRCPHCERPLKAPTELEGRSCRCPRCRQPVSLRPLACPCPRCGWPHQFLEADIGCEAACDRCAFGFEITSSREDVTHGQIVNGQHQSQPRSPRGRESSDAHESAEIRKTQAD